MKAREPKRGTVRRAGWTMERRLNQQREEAEYAMLKAEADDKWKRLYHEIMPKGIRPIAQESREDISQIPSFLLRKNGLPADVMAQRFGYDYIGDFGDWIESVYKRYKNPRYKPSKKIKPPKHFRRGRYRRQTVPAQGIAKIRRRGQGVRDDGTKLKTVVVRAHTRSCPS